jgi:glycosyltransferase involved in cell wall biosynthesis
MEHNTLVSVIIPAYNRAHLIKTALESVLNQTYQNWECIVVDDHSTDELKAVVDSYIRRDGRFRYLVNQRRKGAQGARNTGICAATGTWIAFNDSDDYWLPDKLNRQMNALAGVDFGLHMVVHGDCLVEDQSDKLVRWDLPVTEGGRPFDRLLLQAAPMFQAILTSKSALSEGGLLDEEVPSYQEWDCSLMLAMRCDFIHLREPLFVYRKHAGETISKDTARDLEGVAYITRKYEKAITDRYGRRKYASLIQANILRSIPLKQRGYGRQLLEKNKKTLGTIRYYSALFCLQINFNWYGVWAIFSTLQRQLKRYGRTDNI